MFCSSSWHYDREYSPNGGRRDICVEESENLIDLSAIDVPTLVICGDSDPYLDYACIDRAEEQLPEGSRTEIISGGAHVLMYEAPYYRDFQERLGGFLFSGETEAPPQEADPAAGELSDEHVETDMNEVLDNAA